MRSRSVEYIHIEGAEDPNEYRHGGHHPVYINDQLHGKYRIVHKLGHGTYSTVGLAIENAKSRYVAIKVGTADTDRTEVETLSHLTRVASSEVKALFPDVLDRFDLQGPNGIHPCLVSLPARCNLRDAKEASWSGLLQLDVAQSLAAQLAVSLAFIHSHGYAHADLHLGNLLLQMPPSLSDLPLEELYTRFGRPIQMPVLSVEEKESPLEPGVPSYLVPSIWVGIPGIDLSLDEAKLILSDFGVAFRPDDKSRFQSYTPLAYRPPEALFEPGIPLTLASDIWSLGCIIFELLAHRSLIDTAWLVEQDEVTAQQVELQGRMPPEWWAEWEERPTWYDEGGNPLSKPDALWSWDRRFEGWVQEPRERKKMATIGAEERDALLGLLQRMLAWRPSERPDARQVLASSWMERWAVPAYERAMNNLP